MSHKKKKPRLSKKKKKKMAKEQMPKKHRQIVMARANTDAPYCLTCKE